jgi:ABC-type transport system involved in multi-copper enzyme maturation permease subunit
MSRASLRRIAAVAANTHRESVRERVLYNLVFFAILMMLSGLLLDELSVRQDEKLVKDLGLAAMEIFGILIALFIGVGLVSKELDKRSLYPLLAKPLRRWELLLGKFIGLALTLLVNIVVMTMAMLGTLSLTGRGFDPGLLVAVYTIFLSLLLIVAIALFFSTLTSSTLAAVSTFCLVLAGRYADVIRNMSTVLPDAPRWLIDLVYYSIPNFSNFDLKDRVVYGDAVSVEELLWITLYCGTYSGLALLLAFLGFRRRDLP